MPPCGDEAADASYNKVRISVTDNLEGTVKLISVIAAGALQIRGHRTKFTDLLQNKTRHD